MATALQIFARRAVAALAVAVAFIDVLSFGITMPVTLPPAVQQQQFYPRSPLIRLMAERVGEHRYLAMDDVHYWTNDQNQPELWANRATVAGIKDARGYYPLCLRWFGQYVNVMCGRRYDEYMGGLLFIAPPLNTGMLSALDVEMLLSYAEIAGPEVKAVGQMDFGLRLYDAAIRRGPAFLARSRVTAGMSDREELALLASPDLRILALASAAGPPEWKAGIEGKAGNVVRFERPAPTRIGVEINRGMVEDLLVISEAWHPGWTARIDGRIEAPVVRANHALMGVHVPPGRHRVELAFRPASFRFGLYLTCIGWTILAGLVAMALRRRKAQTSNVAYGVSDNLLSGKFGVR